MQRLKLLKILQWITLLFVILITFLLIVITFLRWVNPPITAVMISERENIKGNKFNNWITLESLGNNISLAIVASEDSNFCAHHGFDFSEIFKVGKKGSSRGASTISQQVSKNLFLWRARSWTRKGIEAVITVLIEALWPKERILEVYLNIAETGKGYFGVASIAQKRFGKEPRKLSLKQAAYIAVTLPNPKKRNAGKLTQKLKNQAKKVQIGAMTLKMEGRASCFITE